MNKFPTLDLSFVRQSVTTDDNDFVQYVTSDILFFKEQKHPSNNKSVLLFPPVTNFHRLLIHKVVETIPGLHSFSIGSDEDRRTVVCTEDLLIRHVANISSVPLPTLSSSYTSQMNRTSLQATQQASNNRGQRIKRCDQQLYVPQKRGNAVSGDAKATKDGTCRGGTKDAQNKTGSPKMRDRKVRQEREIYVPLRRRMLDEENKKKRLKEEQQAVTCQRKKEKSHHRVKGVGEVSALVECNNSNDEMEYYDASDSVDVQQSSEVTATCDNIDNTTSTCDNIDNTTSTSNNIDNTSTCDNIDYRPTTSTSNNVDYTKSTCDNIDNRTSTSNNIDNRLTSSMEDGVNQITTHQNVDDNTSIGGNMGLDNTSTGDCVDHIMLGISSTGDKIYHTLTARGDNRDKSFSSTDANIDKTSSTHDNIGYELPSTDSSINKATTGSNIDKTASSDINIDETSSTDVNIDNTSSTDVNMSTGDSIDHISTGGNIDKTLAPTGDNVDQRLPSTGDNIDPRLLPTGGNIDQTSSSTGDNIDQTPSSTGDNIDHRLSSTGDNIDHTSSSTCDNIDQTSSSTGDNIDQTSSSTGDNIDQRLPSTGDNIDQTSSSTGDNIDQRLSSTGDNIDQTLSSTGDNMDQTSSSTGDNIDQRLPSTGDNIEQTSSSTGDNIDQRLPSTGANMDQTSSSTGDNIDQRLPSTGDNIEQTSSSTGDNIDQRLPSTGDNTDVGPRPSDTGELMEEGELSGDDDDTWEDKFADDGECIDADIMSELTLAVGDVKVEMPQFDYSNYQPKGPALNYSELGHIVEMYNFPAQFSTTDLMQTVTHYPWHKDFTIKWVDDTHALAVFSDKTTAEQALSTTHPIVKFRPLAEASVASRKKAKHAAEYVQQPYKPRPETTAMAMRNMVSGALGIRPQVSREQRERERRQLQDAREKKRELKQAKLDVWGDD